MRVQPSLLPEMSVLPSASSVPRSALLREERSDLISEYFIEKLFYRNLS